MQLQVELQADIERFDLVARGVRVGHERGGEEGRTDPAAIEPGAAQGLEPDRGQVQLKHAFHEGTAIERIDLEPRHAEQFPVALGLAVVHVVVAEPAEIRVGQGFFDFARRHAGASADPERGVVEGQRPANVELAEQARRDVALGMVGVGHERPQDAGLVVDAADRGPGKFVDEPDLGLAELVGRRLDVLKARQRVEVTEIGDLGDEAQRFRRLVEQGMLVGNEAVVPLVAALGRTEQVEEIGRIPAQAHGPQVVPVDQRRVQPLVGLQLIVRAVAGRQVQVVEADWIAETRERAEGH